MVEIKQNELALSYTDEVREMKDQNVQSQKLKSAAARRNAGNKKAGTLPAELSKWRRRWDSNPRALSDYLISSQARYDHFDTSPYVFVF